jgi:hypothetical protein
MRGWVVAIALTGCATDPAPTPAEESRAVRTLSRVSLDVRGVRPSLADLRAVQADPAALDPLVERYLDDPRFGARYAALMAGVWRTPVTEADHGQATYPVADIYAMLESIGQEPLRVVAQVAQDDLPWTELVLGDWTVIDHTLAEHYPTDYPAGEQGWRTVHYTDGRPAAGVLATNGMWWRYDSTQANANRGRANAVSRILLCRDFLEQQIEGDRDLDLLDEEAVSTALRTADACVTCHASLDPMASFFWGFYNHFNFSPAEQASYHPERELDWQVFSGVAPGYHGVPGDTLDDLGRSIAADPRFVECAVERTWEQLLSRPAGLSDIDDLSRHREAFLDGGLTVRGLMASILADPRYRDLVPEVADAAGAKLVTADLLVTQVEGLTGFRFLTDGRDAFATDLFGLRTMAGGDGPSFDGDAVVATTPTLALVAERLAEAAAWHRVSADRANPDDATLLTVDPGARPGDIDFENQLDRLFLQVLGRTIPDPTAPPPDRDRAEQLWRDAFALTGSEADAWASVLAWMLRHPDFLVY